MADFIDTIITACVGALIGVILICSVLIPTVTKQMNNIDSTYAGLITLVVTIVIIGLAIAVIRQFGVVKGSDEER